MSKKFKVKATILSILTLVCAISDIFLVVNSSEIIDKLMSNASLSLYFLLLVVLNLVALIAIIHYSIKYIKKNRFMNIFLKIIKYSVIFIILFFAVILTISVGMKGYFNNREKQQIYLYNSLTNTISTIEYDYVAQKEVDKAIDKAYTDFYNPNLSLDEKEKSVKKVETLKETSVNNKAKFKKEHPIQYQVKEGSKDVTAGIKDGTGDMVSANMYALNPFNWDEISVGLLKTISHPKDAIDSAGENLKSMVKEKGALYSVAYVVPGIALDQALTNKLKYIDESEDISSIGKGLTYVEDGEQFIVKDNKLFLKPNVVYKTKHDYLYSTDDLGRIDTVSAKRLRLADGGRNGYAQKKASLIEGDDGGHLIARRFGGNSNIDNLVSMDSNLNRGEYKRMENNIANALEDKQNVSLGIKVKYQPGELRPQWFDINYTIDGTPTTARMYN